MQTSISEWLEANTHESKRQMALQLGLAPSTFNRNIETFEVIVAVCSAYGLNPVEALASNGYLDDEDIREYVKLAGSSDELQDLSEMEVLDRTEECLAELRTRIDLRTPLPGQMSIFEVPPNESATP